MGKGNYFAAGGLAGASTGEIRDSYAYAQVKGGGIAGHNDGKIINCYSRGARYLDDDGYTYGSFCAESLRDDADTHRLTEAGWDFRSVWQTGSAGLPVFQAENWLEPSGERELAPIYGADELFDIALRIADGDTGLASAGFALQNDIIIDDDRWEPIGTDDNPFTGVFDGCGHTVSGFAVKGDRAASCGLFGVLREAYIVNLTVDCAVRGGQYSGAIAGRSEYSRIACCSADALVCGYGSCGLIVGQSSGEIDRCFAAGKVGKAGAKGGIAVLVVILALMAAAAITAFVNPTLTQRLIPWLTLPVSQSAPAVTVTMPSLLTFENAGASAVADITNPAGNGDLLAVEIVVSDAELARVMGAPWRTEAETAALRADGGYDPENAFVTVYKSGSIPEGYVIESVPLLALPNGQLLTAGEYAASIRMTFYDSETGVQTSETAVLPLTIAILEDI